jgi:hypothetical protein
VHYFQSKNETQSNTFLSEIDNWLCSKFIDANKKNLSHQSPEVRVFTSTIEQRKTQNQVKFNVYDSRIAKIFCTENPNETTKSFDTATDRMPKRRINLTYVAAVTTTNPRLAQPSIHPPAAPDSIVATSKQRSTVIAPGDNSSRLAELETSLQYIQSERIFMQSDHQSLIYDFQKVVSGVLQHIQEIQAMQSDVHSLSSMILEIRNAVLPISCFILREPISHPCVF